MSPFALLMSILAVMLKIFVFGTMIMIVLSFTLGPVFFGGLHVFRVLTGKAGKKPEPPAS